MSPEAGTDTTARERIGLVTRVFHWVMAILLLAVYLLAWSFNVLQPGRTAGLLVDVHRSLGLTVLAFVPFRAAWRVSHPLPPLPSGPIWEAWLATGVQGVLYLGLLIQPLLGWAGSSAQGDTITVFGLLAVPNLAEMDQDTAERIFALHRLVGFAILSAVTLHVAGALRHGFINRDGVLRGIVTGNRRGAQVCQGDVST